MEKRISIECKAKTHPRTTGKKGKKRNNFEENFPEKYNFVHAEKGGERKRGPTKTELFHLLKKRGEKGRLPAPSQGKEKKKKSNNF